MTSQFTRVVGFILLAAAFACGPARSGGPAAQSGSSAGTLARDGGLPPPRSERKGVIVPSDTGLGSQPSGSTSHTGTSAGRPDPGMGTGTPP